MSAHNGQAQAPGMGHMLKITPLGAALGYEPQFDVYNCLVLINQSKQWRQHTKKVRAKETDLFDSTHLADVSVEQRHAGLGDAEMSRVATQLLLILRRLLHQHRQVTQRWLFRRTHALVLRKRLQLIRHLPECKKGKGSPYSITERRVPELIPVLGSQPAGDVNHKPGGTLPLLSARPTVTPATLKRAATSAAW